MSALHRNDKRGAYPASWYAETANIAPQRPALKGRMRAEVCIIGAGYAGLSAALELRARGYEVVVLEAHRAGFGASGRNGGQVGSGFNKEMRWIRDRLGADAAQALWALTEEAKALTRDLAERHAPSAAPRPGVAFGAWSAQEARGAHEEAEYLAAHHGYDQIEPLDEKGFSEIVQSPIYKGGTLDHGAFHLHPLRYALGLAGAAEAAGARIFEGSEAHFIKPGAPIEIRCAQGAVRADFVLLAGNGYLPGLSRPVAARVMPINSFIGATAPLPDPAAVLARPIAVADDQFVLNYFRLSEDNRLLFGGRESYSIAFPRDIETRLRARMAQIFPQLAETPFTHIWGGTLGITRTRLPMLARLAPNMLTVGGFSGHGIALATLAGKLAAEAINGQAARFDLMASLPTPAFPGPGLLRAPMLGLAMSWFSLRDRLGI